MKLESLFLSSMLLFLMLSIPQITSASISVSPLIIELQVPPGESRTRSFLVSNHGGKSVLISVYLADWEKDPKGEHRFFNPGTLSRSCAEWIRVSPLNFELGVGEKEEVRFSIEVPKGVGGTHWAIIFVHAKPKLTKREGIIFQKRVGVKIYQTSSGTEMRNGTITNMSVSPTAENERLKIMVEFENTGNVHMGCWGQIEIRNDMGNAVERIPIEGFSILPGERRQLELIYEGGLPCGQYTALAILDYGGDALVGGEVLFTIENRVANLN